MKKHILITGGCGFVGRNQVKKAILKFPGHIIWVLDNLSTGLEPEAWPELNVGQATWEGTTKIYNVTGSEIRFIKCDVLSIFLSELGCIPKLFDFMLPKYDENTLMNKLKNKLEQIRLGA